MLERASEVGLRLSSDAAVNFEGPDSVSCEETCSFADGLSPASEPGPNALVESVNRISAPHRMTLVAAVLRKYLIHHAEQVGCPCGSDEWLADTLLEANLHDDKEET